MHVTVKSQASKDESVPVNVFKMTHLVSVIQFLQSVPVTVEFYTGKAESVPVTEYPVLSKCTCHHDTSKCVCHC